MSEPQKSSFSRPSPKDRNTAEMVAITVENRKDYKQLVPIDLLYGCSTEFAFYGNIVIIKGKFGDDVGDFLHWLHDGGLPRGHSHNPDSGLSKESDSRTSQEVDMIHLNDVEQPVWIIKWILLYEFAKVWKIETLARRIVTELHTRCSAADVGSLPTCTSSASGPRIWNILFEQAEEALKSFGVDDALTSILMDTMAYTGRGLYKYEVTLNVDQSWTFWNSSKGIFKRIKRFRDQRPVAQLPALETYFPEERPTRRSESPKPTHRRIANPALLRSQVARKLAQNDNGLADNRMDAV